jgi:transcriptional regulator with XRE-family HTH domain
MEITEQQRVQFVELLRGLREARGLKQFEAAEQMGVPVSTLSRLEHGPYEGMRFEDIVLLCRFYHLPVDDVASVVGLPDPEREGSGVLPSQLESALRVLAPAQQAFLLQVLQVVLSGLAARRGVG